MKIGLLIPSIYMSTTHFGDMIFAPRELAVSLADGLVEKGHKVYLFSTADTQTKAELIPGDQNLLEKDINEEKFRNEKTERARWASFYGAKRNYEIDLTQRSYKMAKEGKLDIMHSYHDTMAHFFEDLMGFPTVYSLHDPLPIDERGLAYWLLHKFKDHRYISISNSFRRNSILKLNFIDTVYHGINLNEYSFQETPSDYLLFMGRLVAEKGLHHAITAALSLNMRLEIGTHFPDKEQKNNYFLQEIKPHLQDPLIGKPGMVNGNDKIILYKQARALLFPILWEEPFGMVMVEAMTCGTPVVAYARGSVPEVVVDGVTGFIINSSEEDKRGDWIIKKTGVEGLAEAVQRLNAMSEEDYKKMRISCRKHVEEEFTVKKMVDGYEQVYQRILNFT